MKAKTKAVLIASLVGLVAGIAYPLVDLAIACQVPVSEACVWGKAYLPLTMSISIPVVGGIVAVIGYVLWAWRNA